MKFITMLILLSGLLCTLVPRIPGTIIILAGAFIYGYSIAFTTFKLWVIVVLALFVCIAELGGRYLRVVLTSNFRLTRRFSTDATVGSLAGIVAADALFGPFFGLMIWEIVTGKTIQPRLNTALSVIMRLAEVAAMRFICGLVMILIITLYLFV